MDNLALHSFVGSGAVLSNRKLKLRRDNIEKPVVLFSTNQNSSAWKMNTVAVAHLCNYGGL